MWACAFIALAGAAFGGDLIAWPLVLALSSAVTLVVAVIQVRLASYHGVGWCKLNPRLPEWWTTRGGDGPAGKRPPLSNPGSSPSRH